MSKPSYSSPVQGSAASPSAGSGFLAGHPPDRPKPQGQGLAGPVKNGPGGNGGLIPTGGTFHEGGPNPPPFRMSATGAAITLRPPQPKKIIQTGFFGREAGLKFDKGSGTGQSHLNSQYFKQVVMVPPSTQAFAFYASFQGILPFKQV